MAGPSLKLSVNGSGKDTIDGLNTSLERLRTNLGALKVARPDLGSLDALTSEFRKFQSQFVELAQAQRTSLAEMAEAIKGGLAAAVRTTRSGGKAVVDEIKTTEQQQAQAFASLARQMQKQAEDMSKASARVTNSLVRQAGKTEAGTQRLLYGKGAGAQAELAEMAAYYRGIEQTHKAGIARLEAEYKTSIVQLDKATAGVINAATRPGYKPAGAAWWDQVLLEQERAAAKIETAYQKSIVRLDKAVDRVMVAATRPGYKPAGPAWWNQVLAEQAKAAAKIETEYQKSIVRVDKAVDRVITAARRPGYQPAGPAWWDQVLREQEAALLRMQKLDAAFAARGARAQLGVAAQARAQLDQGVSPDIVKNQFGGMALQAAQAAANLNALKLAHDGVSNSVAQGTPRVKGLALAMNDAHSAARGLASGFGAMFLTWGNIAPLLAGAALSHAFVRTIKTGAEVAHSLATIRMLGGESAQAVKSLEEQLLSLSANGPFGPQQIAEAFKSLTLAGLTVKEQRSAIGDVLNFAIAGNVTIEQAATSLVQISTAFGYTADGFGRVGDVIAKAAAVSLSSVEGLTQSMQQASEVHMLYGQSLVDVATNLAVLSQLGIRGTAAGTSLKNMYMELSGSTGVARKNLEAWNIEVLDKQTGKVKELVPLLTALNEKYIKLSGQTQTRFIQDLSNTRGGKDLAALLVTFNQQAKEDPTALNRLTEMRRQIEESYGFQALAAAQLSLTAKNQMASVAASFQTSLTSAFKGLEPAILQISSQLRDVFGSAQFQANVQNLAVSVGNLGLVLLENLELVKNLALAWLAWKVAMGAQAVIAATAASLGVLAAGYRALTAAKVADTVASGANAVANGAAAASGLRTAASRIPVIGGLLIGAMLLWDLYWASVSGKKNNVQEDIAGRHKALVESLKASADTAKQKWLLLRDPTGLKQMQEEQELGRSTLQQFDDDLKVFAERREAAARKLSAANEIFNKQMEAAGSKGSRNPELAAVAANKAGVAEAAAELNAANAAYDKVIANKKAAENELRRLGIFSEASAQLADDMSKIKPSGGTDGRPTPDEAPVSLANALKQQFSQRASTLREAYAAEQAELDAMHKNKLVGDTFYAEASKDIAQRQYDAELSLLTEYRSKVEPQLAALREKGRGSKADTALVALDEELKRLDISLEKRQRIASINEQGAALKLQKANDDELTKLASAVTLQEQQLANQLRYNALLPEQQAHETARLAHAEKYLKLTMDVQRALADARRDLASVDGEGSGANEPLAMIMRQRIATLEAELDRIRHERDVQSQRAGDAAAGAVVPPWKKSLEEWANATRSMQRYWDETVQGTIQKGAEIWDKFTKTGKLSFRSLTEFIRDQMSKAVYEQLIAPYFAALGKKIAEVAFGKRPGGDSTKDEAGKARNAMEDAMIERTEAVWNTIKEKAGAVWDTLKTGASTVWDFIRSGASPLMEVFSQVAQAVWQFIQSMASSGGGGGGLGSIVSTIGGFFKGGGGGGGFGTGDAYGNQDIGAFLAKGGVFSAAGQLQAFAKGDIFGAPTLFKFAAGAGFNTGVMGEAGPEAVMPLKRGPNGSLGVVNHGGGSGGIKVIINTPPGVAVERTEERQGPNGQEMEVWLKTAVDRAVAKVDSNIQRGGSTAQALKSKGVSLTGALPRRG